jgi:hypothetical protein
LIQKPTAATVIVGTIRRRQQTPIETLALFKPSMAPSFHILRDFTSHAFAILVS